MIAPLAAAGKQNTQMMRPALRRSAFHKIKTTDDSVFASIFAADVLQRRNALLTARFIFDRRADVKNRFGGDSANGSAPDVFDAKDKFANRRAQKRLFFGKNTMPLFFVRNDFDISFF